MTNLKKIFITIIEILFLLSIISIITCKEETSPVKPAPKPKTGINISNKTEEQRINEAIETVNLFLADIHKGEFMKSHRFLSPSVKKVLGLSNLDSPFFTSNLNKYVNYLELCGKEIFPKEVKRENFKFHNFEDWRATDYDRVWFELTKDQVPKNYFNMHFSYDTLTFWIENKNHKYYIGYEIVVECKRLYEVGKNYRGKWGVDLMGANIDINFQDRAALRGAKIIAKVTRRPK